MWCSCANLLFSRPPPKTVSLIFYLGMDEGGGPLTDLDLEMEGKKQNKINVM